MVFLFFFKLLFVRGVLVLLLYFLNPNLIYYIVVSNKKRGKRNAVELGVFEKRGKKNTVELGLFERHGCP